MSVRKPTERRDNPECHWEHWWGLQQSSTELRGLSMWHDECEERTGQHSCERTSCGLTGQWRLNAKTHMSRDGICRHVLAICKKRGTKSSVIAGRGVTWSKTRLGSFQKDNHESNRLRKGFLYGYEKSITHYLFQSFLVRDGEWNNERHSTWSVKLVCEAIQSQIELTGKLGIMFHAVGKERISHLISASMTMTFLNSMYEELRKISLGLFGTRVM